MDVNDGDHFLWQGVFWIAILGTNSELFPERLAAGVPGMVFQLRVITGGVSDPADSDGSVAENDE